MTPPPALNPLSRAPRKKTWGHVNRRTTAPNFCPKIWGTTTPHGRLGKAWYKPCLTRSTSAPTPWPACPVNPPRACVAGIRTSTPSPQPKRWCTTRGHGWYAPGQLTSNAAPLCGIHCNQMALVPKKQEPSPLRSTVEAPSAPNPPQTRTLGLASQDNTNVANWGLVEAWYVVHAPPPLKWPHLFLFVACEGHGPPLEDPEGGAGLLNFSLGRGR